MKPERIIFGFLLTMHCTAHGAVHENNVCLEYGVSGRNRRRSDFQDAYAIHSSDGQILFSLFDGHGGGKAVRTAADSLPGYIFKYGEPRAYTELQKELLRADCTSGTTALTARIISQDKGRKQLELAWVGDSRAIVFDKDGQLLIQTSDHTPEHRFEKKRVVQAGAVLYHQLCRLKNGQVKSITRVTHPLSPLSRRQSCPDLRQLAKLPVRGGLSLSRALGDADWPEEIISSVPEIISYPLHAEFEGYIILASDGVWDVLSNKDVAKYVLQAQEPSEKLDDAVNSDLSDDSDACQGGGALTYEAGSSDRVILMARGLRDLAYNKGSSDNITATVIRLLREKRSRSSWNVSSGFNQ